MDDDLHFSLGLTGRSLRDRATDSNFELQTTLNNSPRRHPGSRQSMQVSSPRHSSKYSKEISSPRQHDIGSPRLQSTRMYDNRALENYNNAVDRLRSLLVTQTHRPTRSSSSSITVNRRSADIDFLRSHRDEIPRAMPDSASYHHNHSPRLDLASSIPSKMHVEPRPQELLQIINSQSAYIQQLEGEHKYCKEELQALKSRIEAVVAENSRLNEEMKDVIIKAALEESPFGQEEKPEQGQVNLGNQTRGVEQEGQEKLVFAKWSQELEKLKKIHDVRVKRLEEQLTSTRSELQTYEKQCHELRGKLRMSESINLLSRKDGHLHEGLCVRCAQDEAVVASPGQPSDRNALQRVTQERDELVSRLTAVQTSSEESNVREAEAYEQVQQSIHLVEQAQLERTEALVQKEQAKEDILRLQGRMAELVAEQQDKLQLEREATRRESQEEIAQLNHKVTKLSEELAGITHQLDKVTREKVDIMMELDQAKTQIMQHEVQITKVSQDKHLSATTAKVQRDEAMRQLERLRSSMQQELRQTQQDKARLSSELIDVRRRMEQAEKDATTSREEGIRLVEKLNTAEREASILRISHESVEKGNRDALRMLRHRAQHKQQDFKQTIHNMDAKNALAVNELENMLSDQQSLITKLKEEGRILTDQLEAVNKKYRTELRQLKQTNAELIARSDRLSYQHADMEAQCVEHGRLHRRMKARLQQMEEQNNKNAKQIFELLQKQTSLMQERQVLGKEAEFLRSQIGGNTSLDCDRSDMWVDDSLSSRKAKTHRNEMIPSKDGDR